MRSRKLVSRYGTGENSGCWPVLMSVGVIFILIGLYFMIELWGLRIEGTNYAAYVPLAFLPLGILVVWGSARRIKLTRKFDNPEVSFVEDVIRPGDTFHFVYSQACRQPVAIHSIGLFLVFRERVSYRDGDETTEKSIDRLVQQFVHAARVYAAGEVIRQEHSFQIPARAMGIRNPYMQRKNVKVQTMWVVKVRIDLEKGADIWKEYKVEIDGEPMQGRSSLTLKREPHQFDLFLLKTRFPMPTRGPMEVMLTLLPHLNQFQIGELFFDKLAGSEFGRKAFLIFHKL